ncbi:hypothetical protein HF086_017371 [Spodoptera exigua]|uniref:AMP-binding enzyme C-terminal domain-containing protein n=1 Tax=Spodoptera exigua TaxID=7107 RepID=A0A922M1K7_SPOEX|nr:hypothetical protein HF086_017371 [Spodoptera exigua]
MSSVKNVVQLLDSGTTNCLEMRLLIYQKNRTVFKRFGELGRKQDHLRRNVNQLSTSDVVSTVYDIEEQLWLNKEGSGFMYNVAINYAAYGNIGALEEVCAHCQARKWKGEPNGMCCASGKVKGYQVPPAELENVLKEHPAVLDAAVVGVPDQATGERPRGFIVLKPEAKANDKDIIEFVSKRVAPYKKINEITFLKEIPKNPSGKILRKTLKEEYCK